MSDAVALWEEWENLRDSAVQAEGPKKDMQAMDAYVRRLLDALDWDRPDITVEDCKLVRSTPALQSVLYDVDLLPEQLASQDEKTPGLGRAYHRFLGIMLGFRLASAVAATAPAESHS